jgi:hypothetical protein
MSVNLSLLGGAGWQFFDNNGVPLSGGLLYTYAAGTTMPQVTYTSSNGLTANTNPIVLNSAGRPPSQIWVTSNVSYKFVLKTSTDVLIATYDNIYGSGSRVAYLDNFTGDGSTVNFTLTAAPSDENNTQVYVNGVYQQKNTYSVSTITLTFSTAPPITSLIEVSYF